MTNSETFDRAVDKVRDEMAKSDRRYVQVVGEFLTAWLQAHPEGAEAILAKGKTVAGSLEKMRAEARKGAQGDVGILDDETAFGVVLEYFGIKGTGNRQQGTGAAAPQTSADPDPFDLDALLA